MDVDEYLVEDGEDEGKYESDQTSSFTGENDMKSVTSEETEKDEAGSGTEGVGVKELVDNYDVNHVCEQPLGDSQESMEGKQEDSDGWLYEDTLVDEDDSYLPWIVSDQQNESSNEDRNMENACIVGPSGPHVKTSAITGVGLQELLELIDEKLKVQYEKLKTAKMAEDNIFGRKWRPPRAEDSGIAVEQ